VIETENPSQDCGLNFLKELLLKIKQKKKILFQVLLLKNFFW